jgi:hypothetical protein
MSRRAATVSQADIARVLRAYRSEGVKVRTRILPDGSASLEPIERDEGGEEVAGTKEIVL